MKTTSIKTSTFEPIVRAVILFEIAFYFTYRFGMAFSQDFASPFWIPDSVLLCALLLSPRRNWWLFLLAPLPIRLFTSVPAGTPLWFLLACYANDSLKALMSAWFLRSAADPRDWLYSLRRFVKYFCVSVTLVPMLSAFAGAISRSAIGYPFWAAWKTWFLGDSLANLIVTPGLVCLLSEYRDWIVLGPKSYWEPLLNAIGLQVTSYYSFFNRPGTLSQRPYILYLQEPFLLWAAMRAGVIGVSAALTSIGLVAVYGTATGHGPFITSSSEASLISIQLFLFVLSTPFMFLSVIRGQQRRTEVRLKESERRFRSLVDTAPMMVWMSAADALCTFFNKPWLDFTGRPLEQQLGNGWTESVHPDDRESCSQQYLDAFAARKDFTLEYRLLHYSGKYRWVLDNGIPRYTPDGRFLGYVGSCIDITERREGEVKLRQMGVQLINAQENERLRIGQELHDDLAQRLSALSMRLSFLSQRDVINNDLSNELDGLRQQLLAICRDVANLSHQLRPPALATVGLPLALRDLCEQSTSGRFVVTCALDDDFPKLSEDVSISLFRVAQEAVRNAQTHSGADRLHLELRALDSTLSLSIKDDGRGFVTGATLKHGLGLSSMAERVRKIGGNLVVTSSPGSGTTITATLLLDNADVESLETG